MQAPLEVEEHLPDEKQLPRAAPAGKSATEQPLLATPPSPPTLELAMQARVEVEEHLSNEKQLPKAAPAEENTSFTHRSPVRSAFEQPSHAHSIYVRF